MEIPSKMLITAAKTGNLNTLKRGIESGCDVYVVDEAGDDILSIAALHGHVEIVQYLLDCKKLNVNKASQRHQKEVLSVEYFQHARIGDVLVGKGSILYNCLHAAVMGGHIPVIDLICNSFDPEILSANDSHGRDAVRIATLYKRVEVTEHLIDYYNINPHEIDVGHDSLLFYAFRYSDFFGRLVFRYNIEVCQRMLIDISNCIIGASKDDKPKYKETEILIRLFLAIKQKDIKKVKEAIKKADQGYRPYLCDYGIFYSTQLGINSVACEILELYPDDLDKEERFRKTILIEDIKDGILACEDNNIRPNYLRQMLALRDEKLEINSLLFCNNCLRDDSMPIIIKSGLDLRNIVKIDFSYNFLTDEFVKELIGLGDSLTSLAELNLAGNVLTYISIHYLASNLSKFSSLLKIYLQNNLLRLSPFFIRQYEGQSESSKVTIDVSCNYAEDTCDELFKKTEAAAGWHYAFFTSQPAKKRSLIAPSRHLSEELPCIVTLACKKRAEHAMIFIENMRNNGQISLKKVHITTDNKKGSSTVHPEIVEFAPVRLFKDKDEYFYQSWNISLKDLNALLNSVNDDIQKGIKFSVLPISGGINCLDWAIEKLENIDLKVAHSIFRLPSTTAKAYSSEQSCSMM